MIPALLDEPYKPFNQIPPTLLYENYLKQWQTEWLHVCPPDMTNEEKIRFIVNRGHRTIIHYFRDDDDGIYTFVIFLPSPDEEEHHYNLYRMEGIFIPSLSHDYSATYLYEVVRHLSLYREGINKDSISFMNSLLYRRRDRPHSYQYMLPQLLYRNLAAGVSGEDVVIKRFDSSGKDDRRREGTSCFIEPVYSPSHTPMKITLSSGDVFRVHLKRSGIRELDDSGTTTTNLYLKIGDEQSVVYDLIAVVRGIVRLPSPLTSDSVRTLLVQYKSSADVVGQLRSSRLSVLEMDIIWSVKLAQVFSPSSPKEKQLEIGKEWHDKIYQEYSKFHGSINTSSIKEDTVNTMKNIIRDLREVMS